MLPPAPTTIKKQFLAEELINGLLSKDDQAYSYLYHAYSGALFATIKTMIKCPATSEDILQNVFEKIWTHVSTYSVAKGSLYTWMNTITRNETISYLRSKHVKNTRRTTFEGYDLNHTSAGPSAGTAGLDLMKSLIAISEIQREIILLYQAGFSTKEIGSIVNLPQGTVKTKMRSAFKKLRILLQ